MDVDRLIAQQERRLKQEFYKRKNNMAKWNRKQIGTISKKTEDKQRFPDIKEFTLKVNEDITLKKGTYLNLENKAFKLASIDANRDKMSEEVYNSAREKIENMPDWVVFEVVKLSKED